MRRFRVLVGEDLVGHAELTGSDPPMGVAAGRFIPTLGYETIRSLTVAARLGSQESPALRVTTDEGQEIPAHGGAQILDFSSELGPEGIEIHVLGIPYPLYEELFPGAHADYVARLKKLS